MQSNVLLQDQLDPKILAFYRQAQLLLKESTIPFMVGGAFALEFYTGIPRYTKDLDVFVLPEDCPRVLNLFAAAGYETDFTFPHWLGKILHQDCFIDVIFSSGNGMVPVDEGWFANGVEGEILGITAKICPVEEMIWSKAFVMERERFDGSDVAHLLRARGRTLDWPRLLWRFGPHWEVLFSHLLLFSFVYPAERWQIPDWVIRKLLAKVQRARQRAASGPRFRGTLLSREQYLTDIECWGYSDPRLRPRGCMTPEEIALWTEPVRKPR